jgi:outer membrane protein OmpA-like peptidoglycan-associated protein
MMFLRNYLLILCLTISSLAFSQRETYRIFTTCFSDTSDIYGVRQIGNDLYLLSASYDENRFILIDEYTNKPYTDLYKIDSCKLKLATLKSTLLNKEALLSSPKYDGPISADKEVSIIFFSNNNEKMIGDKMGIYYLIKNEDGWSESMPFPVNSDKYNVIHPFYDEANKRIFFSSDIKDGKGGFDIYSIEFDGVNFGKITPIESINTSANETFPQYANGRIYFTSDGEQSIGGLDIFFEQAGEIIHLPEPINTVYDDFDLYFIDKSTGFLSTNRVNQGKTDQAFYFIRSKEESYSDTYALEQQSFQQQTHNLSAIKAALNELQATNGNNGLLKALNNTAIDLQEEQNAIQNAAQTARKNNFDRLESIKEQLEALILEDPDLNYLEKSAKISQLSASIDKINTSKTAQQKEQLFEQLTATVISRLSKRPSYLLKDVSAYKSELLQMAKIEQQIVQNSIDVSQVAELVKQESLKTSISQTTKKNLMAINNDEQNFTNVVDQRSNSITIKELDNSKLNRMELINYSTQQQTLINKFKNQVIADIIKDTTKSEKEKLQLIAQLSNELEQIDWTADESELAVVSEAIDDLMEKAGIKSFEKDENLWDAIVNLAANNSELIAENYHQKEAQQNDLYRKEIALNKSIAALELHVLNQLGNIGKLNQENANKVTQLIAEYSAEIDQNVSNQKAIQSLQALNSSLTHIDSSLIIDEPMLNNLLMNQQMVLKAKQQQLLKDQLAYAQQATKRLSLTNTEGAAVGVIQFNSQAYSNKKLVVLNSEGVVVDTIFTDENGVFVYLSGDEADLDIKPVNAENDQVIFYDGIGESYTSKALEANNGKMPLSNFAKTTTEVDARENGPIVAKNQNLRLSNSLMNTLIDNYPLPLIQFRFDSYQIQQKYFTELDELVNVLGDFDQLAIKIIGHTDSLGHPVYNLLLSKNRSKAVKRYLVKKGMQEESFVVEGYGDQFPVSSNDTKEGRKLNRRVEIKLAIKD